MKNYSLLISIIAFSSCLNAETVLSSDKNLFPFKYKPTPQIELTVSKIKNDIYVTYPNKETRKITTIERKIWNSPNITKDLNFDGYTDLAIVVGVNPRGLNEYYAIFLWDNKKQVLKESGGIVNPSIEKEYLVENSLATDSMCENNEAICAYKTRYKWEGNQLITHSSFTPLKNNKTKISFYKDEVIVKTVVVPHK